MTSLAAHPTAQYFSLMTMAKTRVLFCASLLLTCFCVNSAAYTTSSILRKRPYCHERTIQFSSSSSSSKKADCNVARTAPLNVATEANNSLPSRRFEQSRINRFLQFVDKNFFLVGMFIAVVAARIFPALGKNGGILRPELLIGNFGVTGIFLLSGLSLELSQLKKAASNIKLNLLIQLATFAAWPFLVGFPLVKALTRFLPGLLPPGILDGILIMMTLPTTVNMCVILTSTAGGNVASALCNAVISNLAGIFVTPSLLYYFFGSHIQLPFLDMLSKLLNKVLLPVAIGQALRATKAKEIYDAHSKKFKRGQELILLSILWNAFCTAISSGLGLELKHGIALFLLLPLVHTLSLGALFFFFSQPILDFTPGEVTAAMFCASQKTLAFGLPLINTVFAGNPNLAAYCAPIMFIHPLQLIIGSALIPKLEKYTSSDQSSI